MQEKYIVKRKKIWNNYGIIYKGIQKAGIIGEYFERIHIKMFPKNVLKDRELYDSIFDRKFPI